jgi:multiple sugar transport system permease protein
LKTFFISILLALFFLTVTFSANAADKDTAPGQITVKSTNAFYQPNNSEYSFTRQLSAFMKQNPDIKLMEWGGISLPGGGSQASLMMAIAGGTAPDIGLSWFHIIRNEIKQGFLYPLNEWIGEDTDGDGEISDKEAKWEGWKKVPPLWRKVATVDGKVYGIPIPIRSITGIIFRTDMAKAAGLDPNKPPKTWDEFFLWAQKLTDPNKKIPGAMIQSGQRGFGLPGSGYLYLPWVQSAGGIPIVQIKKSPKTGREYSFSADETKFITPDGENLSGEKSEWKADFTSPEATAALDFYYKLRWQKWIVDPQTSKPVTLTDQDVKNGFAMLGDRKLEFKDEDIIKGVARSAGQQRGTGLLELLGRGEVAMTVAGVDDLKQVGTSANIDPTRLSWFPVPAAPGPDGKQIVQMYNHYAVMYEGVGHREKIERDAVWHTMNSICDEKVIDRDIAGKVLEGLSRFAPPKELKRLGYEEYIRDIPLSIRQNFEDMDKGKIKVITEPWIGFWFTMDTAINMECIGIMMGSAGESFDYRTAMREVERKANSGVMFETPRKVIEKSRPYARAVLVLLVLVIVTLMSLIVRSYLRKPKASTRSVYKGWMPVLIITPAVLLITLWQYYPLLRGMLMAFQDYKIAGNTKFVGLDNFIILFRDTSFWMSLLRTCYFVLLNMSLAFIAPIILAILLTEVPRFKIFFRTLFFLPHMTSGIVIALLWKLMYNPTPSGFFNQLISLLNHLPLVNIGTQSWLEDPKLAMICCVLPTVWASMGMASLIYLAALHSIPPDLYEAAEIDGAGVYRKLRDITLPYLLPLIIINFVGAFIGTFQNMGNIFLLTFGGPGEATTVVGLKIWVEAYNNLRFSMATSMAWVLGSLLIGLTYLQIQILGKVEYKRAKD